MKNNLDQFDQITLSQGSVQCIIGILEEERTTPQSLKYEVTLYLDTRWAAKTRAVEDSINYAAIKKSTEEFLIEGQFELLETAVQGLSFYLLSPANNPQSRVKAVKVSLAKPEVFPDSCVPGLTVIRRLDEA